MLPKLFEFAEIGPLIGVVKNSLLMRPYMRVLGEIGPLIGVAKNILLRRPYESAGVGLPIPHCS